MHSKTSKQLILWYKRQSYFASNLIVLTTKKRNDAYLTVLEVLANAKVAIKSQTTNVLNQQGAHPTLTQSYM